MSLTEEWIGSLELRSPAVNLCTAQRWSGINTPSLTQSYSVTKSKVFSSNERSGNEKPTASKHRGVLFSASLNCFCKANNWITVGDQTQKYGVLESRTKKKETSLCCFMFSVTFLFETPIIANKSYSQFDFLFLPRTNKNL